MVSKTTSSETLDERGARVAEETAQISQERARIDRERHDALTLHQRQVDQETVDSWRPRDLDAAVVEARLELNRVIAEQLVTRALATFLLAQTRRSILWTEQINALGQLVRPTVGAQMPPTTGEPDLAEMTFREASAQAEDRLAAEAADRHNRRTIPTTEETE